MRTAQAGQVWFKRRSYTVHVCARAFKVGAFGVPVKVCGGSQDAVCRFVRHDDPLRALGLEGGVGLTLTRTILTTWGGGAATKLKVLCIWQWQVRYSHARAARLSA